MERTRTADSPFRALVATDHCTAGAPSLPVMELGYVFPNTDSDGDSLIDGFERLYGLDWSSSDSDCDGIEDGVEYPLADVQILGNDPLLGGACLDPVK